jgi:4-hydroxy-2-oxoheptanedioate aldolase
MAFAPDAGSHVILMMGIPSADLAELAFRAGIQSVILDAEHGFPLGPEIRAMVLAARANAGRCMVRIPPSEVDQVGFLADIGVDDIVLSGVRAVDEVGAAAARAVFGSAGARSLNPFVPAAGIPGDAAALHASAAALGIWAMAETSAFVDDLARLAATAPSSRPPAWAGIVIGPYDLSTDLGCQPDPGDDRLRRAVSRLVADAQACGLEWGLFVRDVAAMRRWIDVGVHPRTVVLGYDRDLWFQACLARRNEILSLEEARQTDGTT